MAQDKAGIKNRQSKMNNWQLHQKDIYDIYKPAYLNIFIGVFI